MEGLIEFYNTGRGFGFIAFGAKQIFFHAKNFAPGFQPVKGRRVLFEIAQGLPGKPPMAINVRYVDADAIEKKFQAIVSLAGTESNQGGAR